MQVGVKTNIKNDILGISGQYKIIKSSHKIDGTIEKVNITVEEIIISSSL